MHVSQPSMPFAGGVNEGWWNDDEKRRARELIPIIKEVLAKA